MYVCNQSIKSSTTLNSALLNGMEHQKNLYYSPERKTLYTKNNNLELQANVCFLAFSVKREENDFDRKYRLLGGPAENTSSSTISLIEQTYGFISLTNTRSRASHSQCFEFLNNKN